VPTSKIIRAEVPTIEYFLLFFWLFYWENPNKKPKKRMAASSMVYTLAHMREKKIEIKKNHTLYHNLLVPTIIVQLFLSWYVFFITSNFFLFHENQFKKKNDAPVHHYRMW